MTLSRRNLTILGGAFCTVPALTYAAQVQSKPLILGLVAGRSLYAMAAQRPSKGIDWTRSLSANILADGRRVKTILGIKPSPQLFAYDLLGEPLHQTVDTNWTRHAEPGEAGDSGFKISASPDVPKTYLVSNEQFIETGAAVKRDLAWSEILELRVRFKREVIGQFSGDTLDGINGGDSARKLLSQADIIYTGNRVESLTSPWRITTIQVRRKKKESYPGYVKLTWLEVPGLQPVRYFSFGHEEVFSVEFMGVWRLPGELNPVVFVRDILISQLNMS
jgi:hypothetical protein